MFGLYNGDISTLAVIRLTIKRQTEYEQRLDKDPVRCGRDLFASGSAIKTFV
jgi:hypothetical protein